MIEGIIYSTYNLLFVVSENPDVLRPLLTKSYLEKSLVHTIRAWRSSVV